jgi:hypothetical protein
MNLTKIEKAISWWESLDNSTKLELTKRYGYMPPNEVNWSVEYLVGTRLLKTEIKHMWVMESIKDSAYLDELMYLPIQYHRNVATKPNYKGRGEHSVKELEEICNQFEEYIHQQSIIKQRCMEIISELKFNNTK